LCFSVQIHIDPEKCEEFLCAPDLDHVLTTAASETPLHVCRSGTFVLLSEDTETIQRFNVKRTELRKLSTEERDEEDSSVAARKLEMASLIRYDSFSFLMKFIIFLLECYPVSQN
jgi:hypothetical protein